MAGNTKHKIRVTEDEMGAYLQSVENTAFLGKFSEMVTKMKKKMRVKKEPTNGEQQRPDVADLVKRLPARKDN